ncbi:Colicin-E7 immunity protein [invertebrate metagenome]|uniref:Colicin-E7 immunity protein n=1 Tax=invertebrate metagenome TaxID=1711999 RepID=A0A2H9T326_9ZZZZ
MRSISELTEQEFIDFINRIFEENASETDDVLDELLEQFEAITDPPSGTDLIYYPELSCDDTPERITQIVKEWRAADGKPGFKVA